MQTTTTDALDALAHLWAERKAVHASAPQGQRDHEFGVLIGIEAAVYRLLGCPDIPEDDDAGFAAYVDWLRKALALSAK